MAKWINSALVIVGAIACWYQYRLYRLIPSRAFLYMGLALVWLTGYRFLLPTFPGMTKLGLAAPFYLLAAASGWKLYRDLSSRLRPFDNRRVRRRKGDSGD